LTVLDVPLPVPLSELADVMDRSSVLNEWLHEATGRALYAVADHEVEDDPRLR
jgi:hypothetical protein